MTIDVGDLVEIHGVVVSDDFPDPNGFVGIVSSYTLYENDETTFDVELPIAWLPGKHSWTFYEEELVLLEQNITNE